MKYRKFGNTFVVRLDKGEEIIETLKKFCQENNIKLASFSGIGATNKVTIGFFETGKKKYHSKEFIGDFEIAPLVGNISTKDGETYIHAHINISSPNYTAFAGHLNFAIVSATCEIFINIIDGELDREFSDEIGLNLFKF